LLLQYPTTNDVLDPIFGFNVDFNVLVHKNSKNALVYKFLKKMV
jgi:hypothetical protein